MMMMMMMIMTFAHGCGEFDHLPTGIYWGFARIGEASSEENDVSSVSVLGKAYIAAISIG